MHVRRNDEVQVISGDHKGARGRVLYVDRKHGRVVVEGVNRIYKHVRRSQQHPQGGRIEKEAGIAASNVMTICNNRQCPRSGKPVRSRHKVGADGAKIRVCAKCGGPIGSL
jgi:large subunit ribosomal protein L24